MKIVKIEHQENIYTVQLVPNFLERLFGKKEIKRQYKLIKDEIFLTGGGCYIRKDGKEVANWSQMQEAIDNYRRAW